MLIDETTIEEVTEKYRRTDYKKLKEDLILKRNEIADKLELSRQATEPLRIEIGELKTFIETDTVAQILKKHDVLKCVEELREHLITQIVKRRDDERAMNKEMRFLYEDICAIKLYLARGEGLSFEIEPSGFGLDQDCFNCGITIDYDFCHALIDGVDAGSVCIRCITMIEKNPGKYIKKPHNRKYKNVPTAEQFSRADLELTADMMGLQADEKAQWIEENLPIHMREYIEHIETLQKHMPLKENDEG